LAYLDFETNNGLYINIFTKSIPLPPQSDFPKGPAK